MINDLRGDADENECYEIKKDLNLSVPGCIYLCSDIPVLLASNFFIQK